MLRVCRTRSCIPLLVLGSLSACRSAFEVSTGGSVPKGLPFYLKSMVYRQHTTYEYSWLRITLATAPILSQATPTAAEKVGERTILTRDVPNDTATRAAIDRLQTLIATFPAYASRQSGLNTITQIQKSFRAIAPLPENHANAPASSSLRTTGNFVERVSVVDYSQVYYLNGTVPPFGSNNISAELGADGTLSKGATTVVGGVGDAIGAIASAVTGILPIKEYLTSQWAPKADALGFDQANPTNRSFRVELAVEPQSVIYDFTNDALKPPTGSTLAWVRPDFLNGIFLARPSEKPAEKPADDAISFSGKVQLPKTQVQLPATQVPAPKKE